MATNLKIKTKEKENVSSALDALTEEIIKVMKNMPRIAG
jgi:hypothetical protein